MPSFVRRAYGKVKTAIEYLADDGVLLSILRPSTKSGTLCRERVTRIGPNHVHAFITHPDGTLTDLGVSHNLMTNIGVMVLLGGLGGGAAAGNTVASDISTAVGATSITGTGSVWTASNLATPTLGAAGWRVYANARTTANPTVYGNVVSNTTNVLTIDQWWKTDDTLGTTPTSGDAFIVGPGGIASARFMALTTNASGAAATNTALTGEIATSGATRALATFARGSNPSSGSGTCTLQKAFSISGTLTAIHRMALFPTLTSAGGDPMIYEAVLNQDATVGNGDTLTVTDTITLSG